MKERKLLSINWDKKTNKSQVFDGKLSSHWKNFYIGFGWIGFYWTSMVYDGLPMWSLGLGIFRVCFAHCHEWQDETK